MSGRHDSLAALRSDIARIEGRGESLDGGSAFTLGHPAADAGAGAELQRGALHEVFGDTGTAAPSATGFALGFARRAAEERTIVWVRQDMVALEWGEPFGAGLLEWGIKPARLLFVAAPRPREALRAAGEVLGCPAVGALLLESAGQAAAPDLTASRRLALAAGRSGVTAVLLRHAAEPEPSAARSRWIVGPVPSRGEGAELGHAAFAAALVRSRSGAVGRWSMEWDGNVAAFRPPEAHPRAVPAAPPNRPPAALAPGLRRTG